MKAAVRGGTRDAGSRAPRERCKGGAHESRTDFHRRDSRHSLR